MTTSDLLPLLPLIVLALAALALMALNAFHRSHPVNATLTLVGFAAALATLPVAAGGAGRATALLLIDGYALCFIGLLVAAAFVVALFSYGYLARHPGDHDAYYILLLLATGGRLRWRLAIIWRRSSSVWKR